MRLSYGFIEKIFVVISLLLYSGAFTYFISSTNPLHVYIQFCSWVTCFITSLLVLRRWKTSIYHLLQERLILLLAGLVAVSCVWSVLSIPETWYRVGSGGFSGQGVLPFLQITLFGIYFSIRYTLSQQMRLVAWALSLAAISSVVVAMLMPYYGVMGSLGTLEDARHAGAWRGIYVHKNILGNTMALGGIVLLALAQNYHRYRLLLWFGFILSMGLIFLSTSKTALILVITLLILLPLYKSLRWSGGRLIPFTILCVVIGGCLTAFVSTNFESILILLGRDPTLTGRTAIWSAVFENINKHFWFGYGYHTFWIAVKENLLAVWLTAYKIKPSHAHSGFLDLWLDLGFIGLSIFLISLFVNYLRAIQFVRLTKSQDALLPLLLLTYMTQINLSESDLVRESFLWLLYVSISISLSKEIKYLLRGAEQLKGQVLALRHKPV